MASCPGDAVRLQLSVLQADVRVESTAGRGHGIGGNRRISRQVVFRTIGDDAPMYFIDQLLGERAEVAAA